MGVGAPYEAATSEFLVQLQPTDRYLVSPQERTEVAQFVGNALDRISVTRVSNKRAVFTTNLYEPPKKSQCSRPSLRDYQEDREYLFLEILKDNSSVRRAYPTSLAIQKIFSYHFLEISKAAKSFQLIVPFKEIILPRTAFLLLKITIVSQTTLLLILAIMILSLGTFLIYIKVTRHTKVSHRDIVLHHIEFPHCKRILYHRKKAPYHKVISYRKKRIPCSQKNPTSILAQASLTLISIFPMTDRFHSRLKTIASGHQALFTNFSTISSMLFFIYRTKRNL